MYPGEVGGTIVVVGEEGGEREGVNGLARVRSTAAACAVGDVIQYSTCMRLNGKPMKAASTVETTESGK
jgi:hypothetical protein